MNKKHWNTVDIDGSVSDDMLKNLIDDSYDLVVMKLTRKEQVELKNY
jgi:predicted DNA-binding protein (MmcQ/YjbR family)